MYAYKTIYYYLIDQSSLGKCPFQLYSRDTMVAASDISSEVVTMYLCLGALAYNGVLRSNK